MAVSCDEPYGRGLYLSYGTRHPVIWGCGEDDDDNINNTIIFSLRADSTA
jgi:hypothetical protein